MSGIVSRLNRRAVMATALLFVHGLVAVVLLGAISHQ
jgi:hypothetical protein